MNPSLNAAPARARSEPTQKWELTASFAESVSRTFWCPTKGVRHPDADQIERAAFDWADRIGLTADARRRATMVAARPGDFYARFAPTATSEGLFIATCWLCLGFVIDDHLHDRGSGHFAIRNAIPTAARMQRSLEGHKPAPNIDDPYAAALHDVGRRMRANSTPGQVRRFSDAHWGWLAGVCWQTVNSESGRLPSLDEYLAIRILGAGGGTTYALWEIANSGPEIPDEEICSDPVVALTEIAMLIAALDNDAYSIGKELAGGHNEQNIYSVVAAEYGGTPEQVAFRATALRDRMLARFLFLRARTMSGASPRLRRYLEDMGNGIRGNIEWGVRAARYSAARPDSPTDVDWRQTPLAGDIKDGDMVDIDLSTIAPIAWWQRV